jgi:hypothetical protein
MAQTIGDLLQTVQVSNVQMAAGLQVFGLRWENTAGQAYVTLDEALAKNALEIAEISAQGSVPTLKVTNKEDARVFLMAGEQLVGAKQNRVLNASIMVAGKAELPIPVSCVEAGRWRYRSPTFGSAGTMSHGLLRKLMAAHALESYRREGSPSSRQGEVWDEVSRKLGAMGTCSASHALQETYAAHQKSLQELLSQMKVPEGCSGVAFALGGKVLGADLFDRPQTLSKLWPKLAQAHAIDALEIRETEPRPLAADEVRRWLRSGAKATAESFKSPGMGCDIRLDGTDLVGASLVVEDHPVHLEVFPKGGAGKVGADAPTK